MKNLKKWMSLLLTTAVVATSVPGISADAATINFVGKDGEVIETVKSVSENGEVSVDGFEDADNHFEGWELDGETVSANYTVSGNVTVSLNGVYSECNKNSEGEVIKASTCSENGVIETTCSICGEVTGEKEIEELADHDIEFVTTKEATCSENGIKEEVCTVCHETISTNTIAKTDDHAYTETTVKEATCSENGIINKICDVCGDTVSENTAKADHTWDDGVVTKEPTTTEKGVKTFTCSVCDETKTEDIPKFPTTQGKDPVKDTDTDKKEESKKCTTHKWDAGVVTKEATTTEEGVKTYTCTVCKETKTETIAKVPVDDKKEEVTPTIKLNVKSIKLQKGKSTQAVVASGLVKGDKVASWTSSDKKVVTVNKKGKITAKKVGKATITVTTKMGAKATLKVTVTKKAVKLKKITVDKKKVTLKVNQKHTIKVTKNPITAQDKVTFKSSNKKVATVNSKGVVTAKKNGKATITVKAGKKTAKVTVTVKKASKKK